MQAEYQTFIKIVAERAATANNAGERYALGSKSVDIPINQSLMAEFVNTINAQYGSKKYDVPADDVAAREFAVKHGLISETGATAGFIQCRITHPRYDNKAIINTGSTIQLAREIEAHLSLTINVLEKLQGKHEGFSAVKSEIFNKLNREILLEQMQWLINRMNIKEKSTYISAVENLDNQTLAKMTSILFDEYVKNDSSNITAFNQFMAGLRLNMADKFRNDMIHDLFIRGIIDPNNKKIDQQIKAIKSMAKETPSTYADALVQNSVTGEFFTTTATPNVAHKKMIGEKNVAAVRVVIGDERTVWRTPSIAATNDYINTGSRHYDESVFVKDVQDKLNYLSQQILDTKNGGDPNDHLYYNLLTSYGCNRVSDNHQTWSTDVIIKGVHQHNREKLLQNQAGVSSLVLLTNLSVNQWGLAKKSPSEPNSLKREAIDEIHDLADLSLLQLLKKQLCDKHSRFFTTSELKEISSCADTAMKSYQDFLKTGTTPYYTNDEHSNVQRKAIDALRDLMKEGLLKDIESSEMLRSKERDDSGQPSKEILQSKDQDEAPSEKASRVIFKMFINGTYALQEYGMLMQALLLVAETNKMSGCKSANERFASVLDKSINVSDPIFMTGMDQFIQGVINESQLYSLMTKLYNEKNVYEGPGQDCSLRDQGATAKSETFTGAAVTPLADAVLSKSNELLDLEDDDSENEVYIDLNKNKSYNTNAFEPPEVTHLQQTGTQPLQAHYAGKRIQQTLSKNRTDQLDTNSTKALLVTEVDQYIERQQKKKPSTDVGESSSASNAIMALKMQLTSKTFAQSNPEKQAERKFKEETGWTLYSCVQYIDLNTPPKKTLMSPEDSLKIYAIYMVANDMKKTVDKLPKTDLKDLIQRIIDLSKKYEITFPTHEHMQGTSKAMTLDEANRMVSQIKIDYPHPKAEQAKISSSPQPGKI